MEKRRPQRKCIACGRVTDKSELIRVYKNDEGHYVLDDNQKHGGRGCYICHDNKCLVKAEKRGVRI